MAKTFAKIAKTFARLSMTIIATRRRHILILHLVAKYAKIDCKNQIYAKNWVRSTWTAKSQLWQKVNGQSQHWSTMKSADWQVTSADDVAVMTSPRADVSKRNLARDSAWRRVRVRGSFDDGQVSTRR